ncbi:MAG: pilus assembly protein PilP [Thermodesulfovibrionales bacterium]|nr:pilus assembly protein PilP [Thermodesulfovibrionales bacterium]
MKNRIAAIFLSLIVTFIWVTLVFAGKEKAGAANTLSADKSGEIKQGVTYEYSAKGRRDPFKTLIQKPEMNIKKGLIPIESYEVTDFKLIAIMWNKIGYYAVITLPDGKSYTIKEGVRLGLHGGKVQKITKDSVIVKENIKDYRGVLRTKDTILKLRREDEG